MAPRLIKSVYRVDSFATYAYSYRICPLKLFVFKPENNLKIHWANAAAICVLVANESTHSSICILSNRRAFCVRMRASAERQ